MERILARQDLLFRNKQSLMDAEAQYLEVIWASSDLSDARLSEGTLEARRKDILFKPLVKAL